MDIKLLSKDIKFKFRVSGVVIENNKILIEKYKDDTYCLPGGYVALNETTIDAIKREMFEETNLKFEVINFLGVVENFFINKKNEKTHEIDFYYYLKGDDVLNKLNTKIIESGEYKNIYHDFKWINISELYNYKLLPEGIKQEIIDNAFNKHLIIKDVGIWLELVLQNQMNGKLH